VSLDLIRWDAPGPYDVVFSTRRGGVSEGPFASLNLDRSLGDHHNRVEENRRRLCAHVGADFHRLTLNRQRHTAQVNPAVPSRRGETGDGLWTVEPELPLLALGADCALIGLARVNGKPAVAVLHAGRIGLLAGIAEAGVAALGGRVAAVVGPTIGPCCYEVGEEVTVPYRARFGTDVVSGRRLDLWTSAERALCAAGCVSVDRLDLCTACDADRFFSYRRNGRLRGGHGILARIV
jgi:polyphenol oxidase